MFAKPKVADHLLRVRPVPPFLGPIACTASLIWSLWALPPLPRPIGVRDLFWVGPSAVIEYLSAYRSASSPVGWLCPTRSLLSTTILSNPMKIAAAHVLVDRKFCRSPNAQSALSARASPGARPSLCRRLHLSLLLLYHMGPRDKLQKRAASV